LRAAPLLCKKAQQKGGARTDTKEKCKHTAESAIIYCVCALSRLRARQKKYVPPASVKHSEQVKVNHLYVFR
jgi:hypothetical protein